MTATSEMNATFYDGENALFVRVEHTVFQVCPARLRHSSVFHSMMELPQVAVMEAREGWSRDHPVELQYATAVEFSHFMWALHALAHDVVAFMRSIDNPAKCLKLLAIARLAHRFDLDGDAEWALADALRILRATPGFAVGAVPARLLEVAHLWGADSAPFHAAQDVARAALASARGAAPALELAELIGVLERVAIRSPALLGLAYYRLALRGPGAWADPRLTGEQLRRLQRGYLALCTLVWGLGAPGADCAHRLASAWNGLREHMPAGGEPGPPDLVAFFGNAPKRSLGFWCASCQRHFSGESEALRRARSACADDKLLDLFTADLTCMPA